MMDFKRGDEKNESGNSGFGKGIQKDGEECLEGI
jgi:hypothetical protein